MKKNVGTRDSVVRVILAIVILYFMDSWNDGMKVILGIVAAALILTALSGYCLLYYPFNFSTAKRR